VRRAIDHATRGLRAGGGKHVMTAEAQSLLEEGRARIAANRAPAETAR